MHILTHSRAKSALTALIASGILVGLMNGCGSDKGTSSKEVNGWQVCFGEMPNEVGNDVCRTYDGNYIIMGSKQWFGSGSTDAYLLKVDSTGKLLWDRTYGTYAAEYGEHVAETDDRGFLLAVSSGSVTATASLILVRTDSLGNVAWEEHYGDAPGPSGMALCADGGAVTCGTCFAEDNPDTDTIYIHVMKTDASGTVEWVFTDPENTFEFAGGVVPTSDGGFLVTGSTWPRTAARMCGFMLKLDGSGAKVWKRLYTGELHYSLEDVQPTDDGGYIAAGYAAELVQGTNYLVYDVLLLKTDGMGYRVWHETNNYGVEEMISDVTLAPDGGYVFVGYRLSDDSDYDALLLKRSASGQAVWDRQIGGTGNDYGMACAVSTDGGYVLVGATASYGSGALDVYVVKTDALGRTTAGPEAAARAGTTRLSPFHRDAWPAATQDWTRRILSRG